MLRYQRIPKSDTKDFYFQAGNTRIQKEIYNFPQSLFEFNRFMQQQLFLQNLIDWFAVILLWWKNAESSYEVLSSGFLAFLGFLPTFHFSLIKKNQQLHIVPIVSAFWNSLSAHLMLWWGTLLHYFTIAFLDNLACVDKWNLWVSKQIGTVFYLRKQFTFQKSTRKIQAAL